MSPKGEEAQPPYRMVSRTLTPISRVGRTREGGFTLLELVLSLSIVAAMLVVLFGGLRVGLRSWTLGEERAEALQHERSLTQLFERSLGGAYAYLGPLTTAAGGSAPGSPGTPGAATPPAAQGKAGTGAQPAAPTPLPPGIMFQGEPDRIAFVTVSPPIPLRAPIAFTAVTLSMEAGAGSGLAVREKALPNVDPFEQGPPLLVDPSVTALRFRYLREPDRNWEERWDASIERTLPAAVEVQITTVADGRQREHPPLIVPIRATAP
jgi:type II secretory pathway pseudopilin PulG